MIQGLAGASLNAGIMQTYFGQEGMI